MRHSSRAVKLPSLEDVAEAPAEGRVCRGTSGNAAGRADHDANVTSAIGRFVLGIIAIPPQPNSRSFGCGCRCLRRAEKATGVLYRNNLLRFCCAQPQGKDGSLVYRAISGRPDSLKAAVFSAFFRATEASRWVMASVRYGGKKNLPWERSGVKLCPCMPLHAHVR